MSLTAPVEGDKPNGPRSRKGVQTRARLVAAAKEVFEENGFLDARISDIAERAGLSHGSFYHYFESKEEIFREVAATVDELLAAPQRTVVLDPSSRAAPQDRIHEAMRRYLESYREEAKIVGVIEQVSRYDERSGCAPTRPAPAVRARDGRVGSPAAAPRPRGSEDRSGDRGGRTRCADHSLRRDLAGRGCGRLQLRRCASTR